MPGNIEPAFSNFVNQPFAEAVSEFFLRPGDFKTKTYGEKVLMNTDTLVGVGAAYLDADDWQDDGFAVNPMTEQLDWASEYYLECYADVFRDYEDTADEYSKMEVEGEDYLTDIRRRSVNLVRETGSRLLAAFMVFGAARSETANVFVVPKAIIFGLPEKENISISQASDEEYGFFAGALLIPSIEIMRSLVRPTLL
ncbi:MAG TPA: hypothetical protein VLG27_01855 [Candidatus Saccharimonadia bacterium]|nr:hypothetical protein [Candidatus Saccharimonadia bacterium]